MTAAGNARFPDAHAEFTVQLIGAIRSELGEEALDRMKRGVGRKIQVLPGE